MTTHNHPTLADLLRRVDGAAATFDSSPSPPPNNVALQHVLEVPNDTDVGTPQSPLPFVLSFTDLTYSVKNRQSRGGFKLAASNRTIDDGLSAAETKKRSNMRVLLNSVSGEARDGEILAILGASGSGKSTLIDALANRISHDSLKGSITLNGEPLESRMLKVISAYVMQDDLLYPMLTVEETLMFSAEFRLPRSLPKAEKKKRVQTLIERLGLQTAANTIIGDEGHRGVSGGERRRVSIGIDIIHDPIVLFLDEPTSGRPIPENENRTEYALDLIRELEGIPGGTKDLVEHNKQYQLTHSSTTNNTSHPLPLKEAISASISRGKLASSPVATFANPFWVEIGVLTKRSVTNTRRMPELFIIRLGAVLVTGFILATVFWQLDNSPRGVQERLGFFAIAMSTMFYTCADALPVFLHERYIFMRETAYNAYRRSSYVLSNAIVSLPSLVFLSAAFAFTTYFAGFLYFFAIILASFWAASSFVTFLSGVVSHVMLGFTIVVAILAYFLLFSGFFINRDRIPVYWLWFHYISLVKYPYEAVLQNEFGSTLKCFVKGSQIFDNTPLGTLTPAMKEGLLRGLSSTLGVNITSTTCVTTGKDILKQRGVTDLSKWDCLWITVAWGFLFRILFYFSLLLGSKNKRR
ncbi:ABC transporter G family member 6 [Acorus calamus]|uniref:ABC transporter G family member 6 n=1 Tax=Acorus calamus TaxID=4465 RepID=A0AAV9CE84_ACOCL|nr:ABC transporter G family member 6 [Acorus calamus]